MAQAAPAKYCLSAWVEWRPTEVFLCFLLIHVAAWTLVPALLVPNALLDLIEGLTWGREWQWGYFKHPPLQAWLLEGVNRATGGSLAAMFLLSQVSVIGAFAGVWALAQRMLPPLPALASVLLLEGVHYFNFSTPEFNPNVLPLPFWAWGGYFLHCAVSDRPLLAKARAGSWIGLGVMLALATYSKYSSVVLALAMVGFLLLDPAARPSLRQKGPWLAAAACLLLLAPQLAWLASSHFLPFTYVGQRADHAQAAIDHLIFPAKFARDQLLALGPLALLFFAAFPWASWQGGAESPSAVDRRFVTVLNWGPFGVALAISAVFGVHLKSMWGAQMWCFSGLWVVVLCRPAFARVSVRRLTVGAALLLGVSLIAFAGREVGSPHVVGKGERGQFPGAQAAAVITDEWHRRFARPLDYVVGTTWTAGTVSFYSADRPSVMIDGDRRLSPWIDQARLDQAGAVVVWWNDKESEAILDQFPGAQKQAAISLPWLTKAPLSPVSIGWAIVPPRSAIGR